MKKRTITAEDLYKMKFTGQPQLSPDGKEVVYVLTVVDSEKNGYASSLYVTDFSAEPRQLTRPYHEEKQIKDYRPKYSPDGRWIAFLSNRTTKHAQIWLLKRSGGEAECLTNVEGGVTSFEWSPDSRRLIFTGNVKTDEEHEEDFQVISRLRYIGDGEGIRNTYSHIFIYDLENRDVKKVTDGPYNHESPTFSPDGQKCVYLASRSEKRELEDLKSIYVYDLVCETETMVYKGKGPIASPAVSPDGNWIAFAGHEEGETSSSNTWVYFLPFSGGDAKKLTASFDRPVGNYVGTDASYDGGNAVIKWREDARSLYFLTTVGGDVYVKQVTLEGQVSDVLSDSRSVITSFDAVRDTFVFVKADPLSPGDVFVRQDGKTNRLTNHNRELFAELELAIPQPYTYKSVDGLEIEGWFLPPAKPEQNEKAPVVLEIHGGPHTAYGNVFHHEFQLLSARGFAVVYTNPRGSQGYGDDFVKACVADWGNKDRKDILTGLDEALNRFPGLDREKLFITGGSYGGYMTNRVITSTNRFRAAVTQRCISNIYSFFGTSDIGFYFGSKQLGNVDLWEDEEKIMAFSPIRYAKNVQTPTCIIHSEEDFRCPIEQAEQWYVALTRLGVETRFIRFQGENHNLSRSGRPRNRVRRLQEIVGWFERYV